MQVTLGGAFDDQESSVVGKLLAGVGQQVAVDVVQQGVGAGGGEGSDPFDEHYVPPTGLLSPTACAGRVQEACSSVGRTASSSALRAPLSIPTSATR